MLYLNISQQYAKISINTQPRTFELRTTRPELGLETAPATLEIRQAKGQLEIDGTPYRYSIGFKNISDMARDNAELGRQTVLETIGRIAQEGDRMASIESKEDAIVNIASEANYPEPDELIWSHIEAPSVRYNMQPAEINVIPGKLDMNLRRGTVDINYAPAKVDVRMAQYQSVKFWTTENQYDLRA